MMRSIGAVCAGLIALFFTACSQVELEYHGSHYNRAIENTSNEQLLLNIVRASKDLPLHFTGTNKYVGTKLSTGSLTPKIPFGRDAPLNFDLGARIDWSSGLSSVDLGNLNTEEALSRLSADVSLTALDSIMISGIPPALVMNVLFEGVQVHDTIYEAIRDLVLNKCTPHSRSAECRAIVEEADTCAGGNLFFAPAQPFAGEKFHQFVSRATTKCSYLKFQAFLAAFSGTGGAFEIRQRREESDRPAGPKTRTPPQPTPLMPQAVTRKQAAAKETSAKGKEGEKKEAVLPYEMHLHFGYKPVNDAYAVADTKLRKKGLKAFELRLRSPKRIIEYLGEITALQNYAKNRYSPSIPVADGKRAFLFRLLRKDTFDPKTAILHVKGPRNEDFFVPEPEFGAEDRDRTLVVLSMTSHLVNISIQQSLLPAPASIEVRPLQ